MRCRRPDVAQSPERNLNKHWNNYLINCSDNSTPKLQLSGNRIPGPKPVPPQSKSLAMAATIHIAKVSGKAGNVRLGSGMTLIAIVDDRVTNRTIYSRLALSIGEGVTVRAFGDPCEALEWLESNRPDLIVTDHDMPNLDGGEFI